MTHGAVVGRDRELTLAKQLLERGCVPVIWGPPGIGRSAVAAAVVARRPSLTGHALATLAFRPVLAFEVALKAKAPDGDPVAVASWVHKAVGSRTLVCEDVHLAHPATLEVLGLLAGRIAMVITVATGHPRSATVGAAIGGWGDSAHRVELAPLSADHALTLLRTVNPALDDAAAARLAVQAGGIPAWLVAGAHESSDATARQVVDSFDVEGRTALAAAALLARPVPGEQLGPGAGELVDRGAAVRLDTGELQVVGPLARAALRRVPEADRARLHGMLADGLGNSPGERARHLAAAGRREEAVAAATQAAEAASSAVERAGHLHFAARTAPTPARSTAAVIALLAAGDLATARGWSDDLDRRNPEQCLLAARVLRYAGDARPAAEAARSGLRTAARGSETWRRLLVESLWLDAGGSSALPVPEVVAACAGTAEEAPARIAAEVTGALAAQNVAVLRSVDLTPLQPPESLHVGMQVVRALLRLGDGAAARDVAAAVAEVASRSGHDPWAALARVEQAWAGYLLDGDEGVLAEVTDLMADMLAESVRERGQALLRLGLVDRDLSYNPSTDSHSALWAAIAAEAALAADDVDGVLVPAATAGVPSADPITAMLAGPAWIAAATRLGLPGADLADYPLLAAEAAASDPPEPGQLTALAERWSAVAVRGAARCLLAAGTAEARARAAELALDAGLVRWATRAGARPTVGSGPLTPRERQVLELVGAGCTTPMIARRLSLAESTVESHVKSAKAKLGAATRADAVARLS